MAITKKKPTKKKATKKPTQVKKVKEKVEVIEDILPENRTYRVPIFLKKEPIAKDIHVANIFYRTESNQTELQVINSMHSAKLSKLFDDDGVTVFNKLGVSQSFQRSVNPKDWVKNIPNSEEYSGNPYIAYEVIETYET